MPKLINEPGKTRAVSVKLPINIFDELAKDSAENERTVNGTIIWAVKKYLEMQEIEKNRRVRYGTGLPTNAYSYIPRGWPGNNTLSGPLTDFEDGTYDKEIADADEDEIKETLDSNET